MQNDRPFSQLIMIFLLCCGMIICGITCSADNLAGGNSSETTNTKIIASTSEPAVAAKARLIDAKNWTYLVSRNQNPVLDSAVADQSGNIVFEHLPNVTCNLQIDHDKSGILIRNFSTKGHVAERHDTLKLFEYAAFSGSCVPTSDSLKYALFEGTVYNAGISDNAFTLSKIAPGLYPILFKSTTGSLDLTSAQPILSGQALTVRDIPVNFKQYLIDDFDDGDSTSIPGLITGAHWYSYVDYLSTIKKTIEKVAGTTGFALKAVITLRPLSDGSFAGTGVYLDKNHGQWDMSALSSISFRAKGHGKFRVSIESAKLDSISYWPHYGYAFTLDTTWTEYKVPVDSLTLIRNTPNYNSGISWLEASKSIVRIEFEVSSSYSTIGDLELYLDNVKLDGISDSDFFSQLKLQ